MKDKKYIYLVIGSTGEYEDKEKWIVISYYDEDKAKEHVINANKRATEWEKTVAFKEGEEIPDGWNEFDKNFECDYTGTVYYCTKIEIVGAYTNVKFKKKKSKYRVSCQSCDLYKFDFNEQASELCKKCTGYNYYVITKEDEVKYNFIIEE